MPLPRPTRLLIPVLLLSLGAGCASRQLARTVGAGRGEARVSLGGPFLTNLGPAIPLPNIAVGGRYGIADGWDVDGNFSVLGAAFGTVYVDPAVVAQLYAQEQGPALSASLRANLFLGSSDGFAARVYPEVGLHGELPLGPATVFGGALAWVSFAPPAGKPPVLATPYLGGSWRFGAQRGVSPELWLQLAWVSPWQDSTSVIDWAPGGAGALSGVLGFTVPFGGGAL